MSFEPRDNLRHIVVEADCLLEHSALLTPEAFAHDETLRRAFVRSLEIIGEATKTVTSPDRGDSRDELDERPLQPTSGAGCSTTVRP